MRTIGYSCILFLLAGLLICSFILFKQRHVHEIGLAHYECSPLLEETLINTLSEPTKLGTHQNTGRISHQEPHWNTITKNFFRCKGSSLHPAIPIVKDGKVIENIFDCSGCRSHSLPIRNGCEYISPVLIEILTNIEQKTKKQVVITSGHHCPAHHRYVCAKGFHSSSKHMIGAAVTFYVIGLEHAQDMILACLHEYYTQLVLPEKEKKQYLEFKKTELTKDTSSAAWYNKEVMIKFYKSHEGRDMDNSHPYPYISLEIRYDRDTKQQLVVSQKDAEQIYRF